MEEDKKDNVIKNIAQTAGSFARILQTVGQVFYAVEEGAKQVGKLKQSIDEAYPEEPETIDTKAIEKKKTKKNGNKSRTKKSTA